MNTEFCTKCGHKIEYTLDKPKFCSSCGNLLEPANASATASVRENDSSEPNESESVPNITKLEYSIATNSRSLTFGDLVDQASKDPNEKYQKMGSRPLPKGGNDGDIVQQTMDQCRSVREPIDLGGE
jgi:DNA-directed RNA polymerase subunit M/transcription elongation factor TFIIS